MYSLYVAILAIYSLRALAWQSATLDYDNHYDDPNLSLNDVACSNGVHGLGTKGYSTLDSLPAFPNVGGVNTISGWNSPQCGVCYAVTYGATTVYILAVDVSRTGFTVSEAAMNSLTGNQAFGLGIVDVTFSEADASKCNMG